MSSSPFENNAGNQGAGQNYGTQHNYFYALAEQTLIPNVEQPPQKFYVSRGAELAKVAEALTDRPGVSRTAAQAIGEGGYGKTWLA
jgi:hypothetical protein